MKTIFAALFLSSMALGTFSAFGSSAHCNEPFMQSAVARVYDPEALFLLTGKSNNGEFPADKVSKIKSELQLLREETHLSELHDYVARQTNFFKVVIQLKEKAKLEVLEKLQKQYDFSDADDDCERHFELNEIELLSDLRGVLADEGIRYAIVNVSGGTIFRGKSNEKKLPLKLTVVAEFISPIDFSNHPLFTNMGALIKSVEKASWAFPIIGDGTRIYRFEVSENRTDYVISLGSGDCLAGCMSRSYGYATIERVDGELKIRATPKEERKSRDQLN